MGLILIITSKGANLKSESRFPFSANMNLVWNFPIVHALKFGYCEVFGPSILSTLITFLMIFWLSVLGFYASNVHLEKQLKITSLMLSFLTTDNSIMI